MYTIRSFEPTDADYKAVVAIKNAAWPEEPTTVEIMKHNDKEHNPKFLNHRFVVENGGGQAVAQGGCWESQWAYKPGKYGIGFDIHPDLENEGIEYQIYDYVISFLNKRELKPVILDAFTRADKPNRMRFWEECGYKIIQRENSSQVDLKDYDYSRFPNAHQKVLDQGIELLSLPELQARDEDWMQKYYDLDVTASRDIPMPDELTPQPIEEFAKMFKHPCFLPDAHFFAVDNGQWVGLSNLWADAVRTDRIWVGFTGVLRSHRRRGIAKALKLMTFKYAQAQGARYIETENEENNPMYTLNVALGFTPKPQWIEYRKEVK